MLDLNMAKFKPQFQRDVMPFFGENLSPKLDILYYWLQVWGGMKFIQSCTETKHKLKYWMFFIYAYSNQYLLFSLWRADLCQFQFFNKSKGFNFKHINKSLLLTFSCHMSFDLPCQSLYPRHKWHIVGHDPGGQRWTFYKVQFTSNPLLAHC